LILVLGLAGCWPFPPLPEASSLDQRLAKFPKSGHGLSLPVEIYWNEQQVPYIVAGSDEDAAYALGLVHAHLRLGQMTILRQLAQARVAEIIGPEGVEIDRGLRMLDLMAVARESARLMDPETQVWAKRFVEGINSYQNQMSAVPYELTALGLTREPWEVADVIALGHLSGIDVTWLRWSALLPLTGKEDWPEIWAQAQKARMSSPVSFPLGTKQSANQGANQGAVPSYAGVGEGGSQFLQLLKMISKSGSNSYAVGPEKSVNGGAMIASDPHLGFLLPNMYLMAGVKTPNFQAVGLMGPGQPIFSIGRNEHVAWGATNLIGATSDLVDVSGLPSSEINLDSYKVKVRFLPDEVTTVRRTAHGPIISDLDMVEGNGRDIALRWIGGLPSDEIGAGLKVLNSKDWPSFKSAFADHALPSQNMIYADAKGNIGQLIAAQLPKRVDQGSYEFLRDPSVVDAEWEEIVTSPDLPSILNPSTNFVASSNNRPTDEADQLIGYFFGAPDRINRLQSVLSAASDLSVDDLSLLQQDSFMLSSLMFKDLLFERMASAGIENTGSAFGIIQAWDGHYRASSRGALAFEGFFGPFTASAYSLTGHGAEFEALKDSGDLKWAAMRVLEEIPDEVLRDIVPAALVHAETVLGKFETWGDMHRLRLTHPFALVPDVDQEFYKKDLPTGGSSESLMKTAHAPTTDKHGTLFGSQSRHISDMSSRDENYFVLVGGQDGWINSSTFADQLVLWQKGEYIRLPMSDDLILKEFSRRMVLR
jgi:penicillin amidase